MAVCSQDGACRYSLTRDGWVRKETLLEQEHGATPSSTQLTVCWEFQLSQALDVDEIDISEDQSHAGWFSLVLMNGDTDHIVALSHSGAIASIMNGTAELVGEFENGIITASWRPDKEVLALITAVTDDNEANEEPDAPHSRSVLLSMNSQFDVLEEMTIEAISPAESSTTSLCWSPSTVTPTQIAICSVDRNSPNEEDSNIKNNTNRKVRLYRSDTLELIAVGRNEDGSGVLVPNLQGATIAWGAHTALLASIQRKGKRTTQVAFFEPNGLRHREFPLREADLLDVVSLEWNNPIGDLLAVTLKAATKSDSVVSKVQLWHRSNYHWYLKYELQYKGEIRGVRFDDNDPYRLFVLQSRQWMEYTFLWEDSVCSGAIAFSVDGTSLNMTNFDQCFIPPPMYANTITMGAPVCEIAFSQRFYDGSGKGIAVLANSSCVALTYDGSKSIPVETTDMFALTTGDSSKVRSPVVMACNDRCLVVLHINSSNDNSFQDELVLSSVEYSETGATLTTIGRLLLEGRCLCAVPWVDCDAGALLQLDDGTLWEFELGRDQLSMGTMNPSSLVPLMEPCPWIAAIKNPSIFDANHRERLMFGKSREGRLYCHELLLADSISSFSISLENGYLCYATAETRCICRFLPLEDLSSFDPLLGADENHILEGYQPRLVEEGARLVSVLSTKPAIVLQMPRGNLEVNFPRALVLRHVMLFIKNGQYGLAYETMRRQKVDLNLIVDMDPMHFLEEGGCFHFLEQVVNIDHLNLFISNLQNWDSTAEQLSIPYWIRKTDRNAFTNKKFDFSTKINQVCVMMRNKMLDWQGKGQTKEGRQIFSDHFLLPILSTFAKQDPPELAKAIALIRTNAEIESASHVQQSASPLLSKKAQDSIQYLAFLADYELLFNTALGVYDYDMARAIARNSQMDPKVYLPLLRRYMELPTFFARYEVDIKIGRHDAALRNLAESFSKAEQIVLEGTDQAISPNSFEDCMKLIEGHKLHHLGLELFDESKHRRRILLSLGTHSMKEKQYDLALYVFLSACESEADKYRCIEAAKLAKDWRTLFGLKDEMEHETLAQEVADTLSASAAGSMEKRTLLQDAARVLLDYGHDVARAVDLLTAAQLWDEAKRVSLMDPTSNLADHVTEAAVAYAYTCLDDFRERKDAFQYSTEQYTKSIGLRNDARQNGEEALMVDDMFDQGSQFSMASNASVMSSRSTSSTASSASLSSVISVKSNSSFTVTRDNKHKNKFNSKNDKKKKQKKKQKKRVVPGSDEDLRSLASNMKGNLVEDSYRQDVNDVITFLLKSNEVSSARSLFDGYQILCRRVAEIRDCGIQQRSDRVSEGPRETWYTAQGLEHSTEAEVRVMVVQPLAESLHAFFSCIPPSILNLRP